MSRQQNSQGQFRPAFISIIYFEFLQNEGTRHSRSGSGTSHNVKKTRSQISHA